MLGFGEVRPSTCRILNEVGTLRLLMKSLTVPSSRERLVGPFILTDILTENLKDVKSLVV